MTQGRGDAIPAGQDDVADLMDPGAPTTNQVKIKLAITNFPEGGKVEWPASVDSSADLDTDNNGDTDGVSTVVGTLTYQKDESPASGQTAVYLYERKMTNYIAGTTVDGVEATTDAPIAVPHTATRSFDIKVEKHTFSGAQTLGVAAMLYPNGEYRFSGRKERLGQRAVV